jgi:hypothetical protein
MRDSTTNRQRHGEVDTILLGTRMQAESGVSRRKQRLGAHSTRYAKGLPLASRDAVPGRGSPATRLLTPPTNSPRKRFLIATVLRIEIPVSYRKQRTGPFLIATRTAISATSSSRQLSCPACPDEGRESAAARRSNGSGHFTTALRARSTGRAHALDCHHIPCTLVWRNRAEIGGVGKRLTPAVLKTVRPERVSWVRIPPPPPPSHAISLRSINSCPSPKFYPRRKWRESFHQCMNREASVRLGLPLEPSRVLSG